MSSSREKVLMRMYAACQSMEQTRGQTRWKSGGEVLTANYGQPRNKRRGR